MAKCPKCGVASTALFCSCGQDLRAQYPQFADQAAKADKQSAAVRQETSHSAVANVLTELGLHHHAARFEQERMDLPALLACSDTDLQSVGVAALGERKTLLAWIAARQPRAAEQEMTIAPAGGVTPNPVRLEVWAVALAPAVFGCLAPLTFMRHPSILRVAVPILVLLACWASARLLMRLSAPSVAFTTGGVASAVAAGVLLASGVFDLRDFLRQAAEVDLMDALYEAAPAANALAAVVFLIVRRWAPLAPAVPPKPGSAAGNSGSGAAWVAGPQLKRRVLYLLLLFPLFRALRGLAFGFALASPVGSRELAIETAASRSGANLVIGVVAGLVGGIALFVLAKPVRGEVLARDVVTRVGAAGLIGAVAAWIMTGELGFTGVPAALFADMLGAFLLLLMPKRWASILAVAFGCIAAEMASWAIPFLLGLDSGLATALPSVAVRGALLAGVGFWGLVVAHFGFLIAARQLLTGAEEAGVPPIGIATALRDVANGTMRVRVGAAAQRPANYVAAVPTRACPFCAEQIQTGMRRCPFCAEVIGGGRST